MVADLEKDISEAEIGLAIKNMQSSGFRGPDGFSADFFKTFIDLLSILLLSVYTESLNESVLPVSMRQAC